MPCGPLQVEHAVGALENVDYTAVATQNCGRRKPRNPAADDGHLARAPLALELVLGVQSIDEVDRSALLRGEADPSRKRPYEIEP
jgi:hypothetical protein